MADLAATQEVRIVAYSHNWMRIYSAEVEAIRAAITPARAFIDHVGSTAIAGLDSKPVIDLLVELIDWEEADAVVATLANLGYCQESIHNESPRRFLQKSLNKNGAAEAINLHLTPRNSAWGSNMLLFRDELIGDGRLASRYTALKRQLATDHPNDLDAYTAGKSDFVQHVLRTAAGAFSNDRLLTHQRAELDRAQCYQNFSLAAQLCVAVVTAVSVYSNENGSQLNFALLAFLLAGLWFGLARRQRAHRAAGDQARRVVLLASGLGEHFSAEQRLRIFDKFTVSIHGKTLVREESYFASRAAPGFRRLTELIEESAYWTRDLQQASAASLQLALIGIGLLMAGVLWTSLPSMSTDAGLSLARVLVALLVFLLSSDVIGAMFAHREAASTIGEILQRAETAAARNYPDADVLLLMSDYNATVESAPFALPGIFRLRRTVLLRRWRSYLENKRR